MTSKTLVHIAAGAAAGAIITALARWALGLQQRKPLRVLITGAAGQIGYALAPLIARGCMLGPDQPVILHLLDLEAALEPLNAVKMELLDSALPLLQDVLITTNLQEACQDVDIAVMVGGFPRKAGMERKDVMAKNVTIYKDQATALNQYAARNVKIVVVANPANTNAFILKQNAPDIPAENITCLTRLDHNRALAQIATQSGVPVRAVKNVTIWGNHSSTQWPDISHATAGGRAVKDFVDSEWLENEFVRTVRERGAAIIKARGLSSALSAASATCDHVYNWLHGTPHGQWVSMGVVSDGSYGVAPGLVYSYPVRCSKGQWDIVKGLAIDEHTRQMMLESEKELIEEQEMAIKCIAETAASASS